MRHIGGRLIALVIGGLMLLGLAGPAAQAESGDRISNYDIHFTIRADGSVDVVEDIDYVFAEDDRHGIYRTLVTRRPFGDGSDRDVLYRIRNVEVNSPDAPDAWSDSVKRDGFRFSWLELRIGDPDETLDTTTATYRIAYSVHGALRTVDGIPELYWNATGHDWSAAIDRVRITVTGPQGVTSMSCYQGAVGSSEGCATHTEGQTGVAEATGLAAKEGVTISAQVPAASVRNAEPIVEPAGSFLRAARPSVFTVGGSALVLVLSVLGAVWARRVNRDQRFAGLAPGTIDPSAPVETDAVRKDLIPVRFNPPEVPPAIGGVLLDSSATSKAAATTLIDLANRGVLRIEAIPEAGKKYRDSGGVRRSAIARDLSKAPEGYADSFARALFDGSERIDLDKPDSADKRRFSKAVSELVTEVSKQPRERGWRTRGGPPRMPLYLGLGLVGVVVLIAVAFTVLGEGGFLYLGPLAAGGVALIVALVLWATGHRTAQGRALTDQVVGFRRYLETAEARTLRFEEGQDIFSAFLPWAIVFGVADRWQRVCAELAAEGRIPDSPSWYSGPAFYSTFTGSGATSFGESLSSSISSASASSSGAGGGGSSGGGGGGGGGGSW